MAAPDRNSRLQLAIRLPAKIAHRNVCQRGQFLDKIRMSDDTATKQLPDRTIICRRNRRPALLTPVAEKTQHLYLALRIERNAAQYSSAWKLQSAGAYLFAQEPDQYSPLTQLPGWACLRCQYRSIQVNCTA